MKIQDTFKVFLRDILIYKKLDTYRFYFSHCKNIELLLGNIDIENINKVVIDDFIIKQKNNKLTNSTINKRLMILRQILKRNNLDYSFIPHLKEVEKNFNYLNFFQVKRLLDYIHKSDLKLQNKLILRLFLDTGCRLTELLNIKIYNIDFANNCILLEQTKTDKERYVFFTDDVKINYLIPYLDGYNDVCANLFNINKNGVQAIFYRANKHLKFKHFSPHVLRHTYATILVNNNTNLEFIRNTLGHRDLSTTKRYLHSTQENLFATYKENFKY